MIECIRYTPINKDSCLGIASIYIDKWDLEINGIGLYQKNGKRWINLPSKPYESNGETKYAPYFRFRDKENYLKFCTSVKDAIDRHANSVSVEDEEVPF